MQKSSQNRPALRPLQRLSLRSFRRPRQTALLWLVLVVFGAACYGTLLKREGFPSVNTPFALANGSYLVHDAARVDKEVAQPLSEYLLKQEGVKTVQTSSFANFFNAQVSYDEGVDASRLSNKLSQEINAKQLLPPRATLTLAPYEFGFTVRGDDLVVAFYHKGNKVSAEELIKKGGEAAGFIRNRQLPLVKDVSVINPFESATNPLTNLLESNQKSFDRFGHREAGSNVFYQSAVIGVMAEPGADNLELDAQVQSAVDALNIMQQFKDYRAEISASYAPQIHDQINELQSSLLEGLIAVLIIGSLIIAIRASLVTVLSMVTVLAIVNGLLYLFGYSLNTITLFALILSLSLVVDDTIIMVEAIDAQRRRQTDAAKAISQATGKVSRAMIAATTTSALSFAPLLFVGGILGSFIRAIPITIIAALVTSLFVALVFIPLFARYLLLSKKQLGARNVHEPSAVIEARIARFIAGPMLWAKGSTKKLFGVGLVAVLIGLIFIGTGGYLFQKVTFNIFPASKDTNQLSAMITYPPNTDIRQAQAIADDVDHTIARTLGNNFVKASYYGQADIQRATMIIDLTPYNKREPASPELVKQLNSKLRNYPTAEVVAAQVDAGPPAAAFAVRIEAGHDREAALRLAEDIARYLRHAKLERIDGSKINIDKVSVANSSIYTRADNTAYVEVSTTFVDTDTSTLVTVTKDAVSKEFTANKVASYGLPRDAISFSAGQEDENQDSFKTLALAFPILLLAIYFVLAFQFRSLLQPALIFMALPFSLFGITLGLYLTDNAFSFFAMLGFFALIGLSIKNTILLTDFANQARKAGMHPVDAAHEALAERFRPLIATSFTAVFSLIPLALSSPFWEGLAVVLICGLLSSTFLVITVFPYYYLGGEFLRLHINRRAGVGWLLLNIMLGVLLSNLMPVLIPLAPLFAALPVWSIARNRRQRAEHARRK